MKITITNIDDFTPFLGKSKGADAGFEYIKKFGKLYSKSDTIKETIDKSLLLINKIVSENEPQKKPRKGKYTTAKGKYKITSRRKKGEPKEKKEAKKEEGKPAKKPKTTRSTPKNSTSSPKNGTKAEKKTDKTAKTSKSKKEGKPKVGEAEPWQITLRYFATYCCGKEKTVTSIRKFIKQIQTTFSAKLGNKTPHIDLIRDIQKKLLPMANSSEVKVSLPEWSDLKKRCQEAAKDKIISKTVKRPKLTSASLSGLKKKKKRRSCR